jgi:hypothetical protein
MMKTRTRSKAAEMKVTMEKKTNMEMRYATKEDEDGCEIMKYAIGLVLLKD